MSTGLNFQTCTIINSNKDIDTRNKTNNWLFKAISAEPSVNGAVKEGSDIFRVKRDFVFKKNCIVDVRKAVAEEAKMCKATIDFNKLFNDVKPAAGARRSYGRIDIYLGLEGSEEFLYACPWIQKGMPLWVEFVVESTDSAETLADKLVEDIKKDKNFLIDHELILVSADNGVLTLEGADEYQRLRKVEVSVLSDTEDYTDSVASMKRDDATAPIKLEEFGSNGFGTYSHIIRDLRLPTVENTYYSHIRQAETPVLGALYDQYIIEYCDVASNDGTMFVGQKGMSHTTHVFWVNQAVSEEFETELNKVFGNGKTSVEETILD